MRRRGFTLLELLVALLLVAVGLLAVLGAVHRGARAERGRLDARERRAQSAAAHERLVATHPRWRAGVTLVELLMVLALAGVLTVVAAAAWQGPAATARRSGADHRSRRYVTETAADLLAHELREGLAAVGLGDTAIALERIVGSGASCVAGLAAPVSPEAWRTPPRAGDTWRTWHLGRWDIGVASAVVGASCPDGRPGWRATGVPDTPSGAVVVVTRQARWVAYRDADGRWQLGLREATASGWDAVQPAVGPFARLRLAWRPDPAGGLLTVTDDGPGGPVVARRVVHPRNR